jgi:hypothetical protein
LIRVLCLLSGLACVTAIALWIGSHYRSDSLSRRWHREDPKRAPAARVGAWYLNTIHGALSFGHAESWWDDPRTTARDELYDHFDWTTGPDTPTHWVGRWDLAAKDGRHFRGLGFRFDYVVETAPDGFMPPTVEERQALAAQGGIYHTMRHDTSLALQVPFWAIAVLFGITPVIAVRRALRRQRRARRGLCLRCGYDLRASLGRCPECGDERAHPPPPGAAEAAEGTVTILKH